MEVKRNEPEPVKPPATYDITGLTLREAGALKELVMGGIVWTKQERDLENFFYDLYDALPCTDIKLDFDRD